MSQPLGQQAAANAANINTRLMQNYFATGAPAFTAGLGYTQGRLGQIAAGGGLPGYVEAGYNAARAGATEGAYNRAATAARRARSPNEVTAYDSPLAGAAIDAAKERAGVGLARAGARINEQQGLLTQLAGGSAQSTDLSAGFGRLGIGAIHGLMQAGDPVYGGVTGGLSALLGAYGSSQINNRGTALNNPTWNPAGSYSAGFSQGYSEPYT